MTGLRGDLRLVDAAAAETQFGWINCNGILTLAVPAAVDEAANRDAVAVDGMLEGACGDDRDAPRAG